MERTLTNRQQSRAQFATATRRVNIQLVHARISRRDVMKRGVAGLAATAAASSGHARASHAADIVSSRSDGPWLGVHLELANDDAADALAAQLPALTTFGVNVLVVEIDYSFEFAAHRESRMEPFITRDKAKRFADACRRHRLRLIPEFNCLGHQSWKSTTFPLLTRYPQFDETPERFPGNEGLYCRSWCPLHTELNPVVFSLMDDLIDGFEADAFHVGMDEVLLIASEFCPRCNGKAPADLFAKAVNDFHTHLVQNRHVQMLMWGDRLLDGKATGYGSWEGSENRTFSAIDKVPRDVVVCDWHYGKRDDYPSIPYFIQKGFGVWPTGWDSADATDALVDCEVKHRPDGPGRMLGHLCSTWGRVKIEQLVNWPPIRAASNKLNANR